MVLPFNTDGKNYHYQPKDEYIKNLTDLHAGSSIEYDFTACTYLTNKNL